MPVSQQKFYVRFVCLFAFAVLATLRVWISTHIMTMQGLVDEQAKRHEHVMVESNQLLLTQSKLISRDLLHQRAGELGYQEPSQILYVLQP